MRNVDKGRVVVRLAALGLQVLAVTACVSEPGPATDDAADDATDDASAFAADATDAGQTRHVPGIRMLRGPTPPASRTVPAHAARQPEPTVDRPVPITAAFFRHAWRPLGATLDRTAAGLGAWHDGRVAAQLEDHVEQGVRQVGQAAAELEAQGRRPGLRWAPVAAGAVRLATDVTAADLGDGTFRVVTRQDPVQVRQGVRLARVPQVHRERVGELLDLYAGGRRVCTARVTRLALDVRFRLWETTLLGGDSETADRKAPARRFAQAAFAHELAQPALVAEVEAVRGDCRAATWARSARLVAPPTAEALPDDRVSRDWRRRALRLLRDLPQWRQVQAEYLAADYLGERAARWDRHDAQSDAELAERLQVALVRTEAGGWLYAALTVGGGCGDFQGDVQAVWRLAGDLRDPDRVTFTRRGARTEAWFPVRVEGVADLDGDGRWELLLPEGRVGEDLEGLEQVETPEEFVCPC